MAYPRIHALVASLPLVAAMLTVHAVHAAHADPAANTANARDGRCTGASGVTVVVDATALDGDVTVRCVPDAEGMSGLEALKTAGFEVTGTRRYGAAMMCRIDGRPAPDRDLAIPGNNSYNETCGDTPPADALWTYWQSDRGEWTYSRTGAKGTEVEPGGFEGWSFTIDPPPEGDPPDVEPVRGGGQPRSSEATADPSEPPATDAGTASESVESGGDPVAPWVAAGGILALAGLGAVTAVRRRRTRPGPDT